METVGGTEVQCVRESISLSCQANTVTQSHHQDHHIVSPRSGSITIPLLDEILQHEGVSPGPLKLVAEVCTASSHLSSSSLLLEQRYEGQVALHEADHQNRRRSSCIMRTNCINIRLIRPTPRQLNLPTAITEGCIVASACRRHYTACVVDSLSDGTRKVCEPPYVRAMVILSKTQRCFCTCIGLVDQSSRAIPSRQHAVVIKMKPGST